VLALAASIAAGVHVSAHRRDEYLQAVRLGIEAGRVQLELDLTPGIAMAESIVASIDRDRDGLLSPDEQRAYVSALKGALTLTLDGTRVALGPFDAGFPDADAMRRGEGTIRLRATGTLPPASAGTHRLSFRNDHHPEGSVYLANALMPENAAVEITAQRRDADQRELQVDYVLAAGAPDRAPMPVPGAVAVLVSLSFLSLLLVRAARLVSRD
jgi:hypothetical protein